MRSGATFSALFHVVIVAMMTAGLPLFAPPPPEPQPPVFEVELAQLAERSNPAPKAVQQQPKPEPPKPEPPKPEPPKPEPPKPEPPKPEPPKPEPPKPEPPKPEPPKPEPPKPELPKPELPKPEPAPKPLESPKPAEVKAPPKQVAAAPQPRPRPRPVPPEKTKPAPRATDQLAALLDRMKPKPAAPPSPSEASAAPKPDPKADPQAGLDQPLSMSEIDAIRGQIIANWFPPFGSENAAAMEVWVRISLTPDGFLVGRPQVLRTSQVAPEKLQPFVDSTIRAILRSEPLRVPQGKYESFRDIEFKFNVEDMLRG